MMELQGEVTRLTGSLVERDGELGAAQTGMKNALAELEELRAEHFESLRALESASMRLDDLHAQARGQATRIRLKALREAIEIADRVAELVRLRDDLSGRLRTALEETANRLNGFEGGTALQEVVQRAGFDMSALDQAREKVGKLASAAGQGAGDTGTFQRISASMEDAVEEVNKAARAVLGRSADGGVGGEEAAVAATNGHVERPAEDIFEGIVRVEIGPLDDFSQLVSFEDAAGEIGATSEVSIERFSDGRATLAMKLDGPVELLRELEERSPVEFKVRDLTGDRVVLDVDDE
jgi:hypothetical protein